MNDKKVSLWVGIFSILNTIQFLIFDLNEVITLDYQSKFSIYEEPLPMISSWLLRYKKGISIGLATVTVGVSSWLLYCVHRRRWAGLLCYAAWVVLYELISFVMVLYLNKGIKEQFKELGYLHLTFQISRMLLHFICVPFILRFTYSLYKDPKTSSKTGRRRCSSISTIDSWPSVGLGRLYRKLN